jgi:hypothetical protein
MRKRITCPETAHLEEVDLDETPHGLLVTGCSRFSPSCAVRCGGECARRLDQRDRELREREERVLVVYARSSYTRPVADALAHELARDQLVVELADADAGAPPPPDDYDLVVLGSPLRFGRLARPIVDYVEQHRGALVRIPSLFFAVGASGRIHSSQLRRAAGWLPARSIAIARPAWYVRWFGDPVAQRAAGIHALALAIADELPTLS